MIAAAVIIGAAVMACMTAAILTSKPGPPGRHEAPIPPPGTWAKSAAVQGLTAVTDQWMKANGLRRRDDPSDTGSFPAFPREQDQ